MICQTCHADVKPGAAHIRSSTFVQVAWCGPCWDVRPLIPAQRAGTDEKVGGALSHSNEWDAQ